MFTLWRALYSTENMYHCCSIKVRMCPCKNYRTLCFCLNISSHFNYFHCNFLPLGLKKFFRKYPEEPHSDLEQCKCRCQTEHYVIRKTLCSPKIYGLKILPHQQRVITLSRKAFNSYTRSHRLINTQDSVETRQFTHRNMTQLNYRNPSKRNI